MPWMTVDIGGKGADVFEPSQDARAQFGVLHLHGIGLETLIDRPVFTRWLEDLQLACVCPHGQRSWWADRICSEFDDRITPERYLLEQVVPYFNQRWGLAPRAVGLQGISMGGQGALRLAFKHPELFPVVAAISAAIDYHELYDQGMTIDSMYDSKEQCRQDTALLHIHPSRYPPHIFFCIDPDDVDWHRGNDRLHEKLAALGIPHEMDLTTRAGGHSWEYFNHMAARVMTFLTEALDAEECRFV